jgi:hypothetical protein
MGFKNGNNNERKILEMVSALAIHPVLRAGPPFPRSGFGNMAACIIQSYKSKAWLIVFIPACFVN